MSQILNLIFDSTKVSLFRSKQKHSALLEELKIDSSASFFLENVKEVIRKNHEHPELIRIYFMPEKYTLIPSSVFLPSKIEDYFTLNFEEKNDNAVIQHETIIPLGTVIVYSLPNWIHSLKSEINAFGDVKTILGGHLAGLNNEKPTDLIRCSIQQGKMDVIVKTNGKLVLANQYEVQNEDDMIYFLLLIVQKFSLSSSNLQLVNNTEMINLDRFRTISNSIQELNNLKMEIIDNNTYHTSILCA